MKKVIEYQETSVNSEENCDYNSYGSDGVYLNTDENGLRQFFSVSNDRVNYVLGYECVMSFLKDIEEIKEQLISDKRIDIDQQLFSKHKHAGNLRSEDIVYTHDDVLEIVKTLKI